MLGLRRNGQLRVVLAAGLILVLFLFFAWTDPSEFGSSSGPRPTPTTQRKGGLFHDDHVPPVDRKPDALADHLIGNGGVKPKPAKTRPKQFGGNVVNNNNRVQRPRMPEYEADVPIRDVKGFEKQPPAAKGRGPAAGNAGQQQPNFRDAAGAGKDQQQGKGAKWVAPPFAGPKDPVKQQGGANAAARKGAPARPFGEGDSDAADGPMPARANKQPDPMKPGVRQRKPGAHDDEPADEPAAGRPRFGGNRKAAHADDVADPVEGDREPADLDADLEEDKEAVAKAKRPVVGIPAAPPRVKDAPPGKKAQGWGGARFKQKPIALDDESSEATQHETPTGILAHPLVANVLGRSLGTASAKKLAAAEVADEDSFQADAPKKASTGSDKNTLTVCAMVTSEQRFLTEWLLYHRLMGVTKFALYDTGAAGAAGAAEVDRLAEKIEAEGKGAMGPSVPELKGNMVSTGSGLDASGKVWPERIYGLEDWIDQGVVEMHWMRFKDAKKAQRFHQEMLRHCVETYSPTSDWLVHLDVDEYITLAKSLYSSTEPYQSTSKRLKDSESSDSWKYPLHEVLQRSNLRDTACIPLPALQYRNLGVRRLGESQSLLQVQSKRDVADHEAPSFKTLIHPNFQSDTVSFDGAHSCRVSSRAERQGLVGKVIKNSQGKILLEGPGVFTGAGLPFEPLAIAHYIQRDLEDCRGKLSSIDDPNNLREKGRGVVTCEEHYLPSPEELASSAFRSDKQNRFLAKIPDEGTVIDDVRVKDSWAGRAAAAVLKEWAKSPADHALAERVRDKVNMLSF